MKEQHKNYLDAARAALMLLGIPFHASLIYSHGRDWSVSSPEKSHLIEALGVFIHSFRMQAFFAIAGYFSLILIQRRGAGAWLNSRFTRLGIPLLAATFLLNPIQMFTEALAIGAPATPAQWDDVSAAFVAQITTTGAHWKRHLWFLGVLLLLSGGLAFAWRRCSAQTTEVLITRIERIAGRSSLFALGVGLALVATFTVGVAVLHRLLGPSTLAWGAGDILTALRYVPAFGLGLYLAHRPPALARFIRPSALLWALGFTAAALYVYAESRDGAIWSVLKVAAWSSAGLLLTHVVFSFAKSRMDTGGTFVQRIVEASFSIYLVHQPIVGLLGLALLYVAWPPMLEFTLLVVATAILSYGFHAAIRRSALLIFLFNGVKPKHQQRQQKLRLNACACKDTAYSRSQRALWMRLFASARRLYRCDECGAKMLLPKSAQIEAMQRR